MDEGVSPLFGLGKEALGDGGTATAGVGRDNDMVAKEVEKGDSSFADLGLKEFCEGVDNEDDLLREVCGLGLTGKPVGKALRGFFGKRVGNSEEGIEEVTEEIGCVGQQLVGISKKVIAKGLRLSRKVFRLEFSHIDVRGAFRFAPLAGEAKVEDFVEIG